MFSKKIHVGKASVPLKSVLTKLNEPVTFVVNLVHDGKKGPVNQGKVTMRGKLDYNDTPAKQESASPPTATTTASAAALGASEPASAPTTEAQKPTVNEPLAKSAQPVQPVVESERSTVLVTAPVTVRLVQVVADVRKNVEFMPGDLNDLYVVTKVGKKWTHSTQMRANSGLHAEWKYDRPNPELNFSSTWAELATLEWIVQVLDHNDSVSHVLIGENTMTLSSEQVAGFAKSELLNFKVPVVDKNRKPIGEVEYALSSTALPVEKAADAPTSTKPLEDSKVNPVDRPTMQKLPAEDPKPPVSASMAKVPERLKLVIEKIHVEDLLDTGGM
ncbi:hypothetical protein EON65_51295, partial [archaeon]